MDPGNKYKLMWDLVMNSIYILSFFLMPLVIAFRLEPLDLKKQRDLELFMDFMMVIDILLTFVTAYYEDVVLKKNIKDISVHYLTSFFFFDFLSCFPSIFVLESKSYPAAYYLKLFRFLQITRLFSQFRLGISKIKNVFMGFVGKVTLDNFFSLATTLIFLIMVLHLLACIWIGIGFNFNVIDLNWY